MIRCNDEGIPKLVQSIRYAPDRCDHIYKITLINGNELKFIVDEEDMIGRDPESPASMINAEYTLLESYPPQSLIDISH